MHPSPRPRLDSLRREVLGSIDLGVCNGCSECALRCERGVPMTHAEYCAIAALGVEPEDDDAARRDRTVDLGDGVTVELCRFLDPAAKRCTVYPARPLVCRLLGHVVWLPCPIGRVTRTAREEPSVQLMQAYAGSERRTYEEWAAHEPPGRSAG